ncbi:MAG: DUF29 domain-containing protein [Okeania sp. SIO3H1]|uniref:DUF29 family protein n=1 Tax=Okeania sp. SIO1I7 TaxID=2607772 RepID=UPI0013C5DF66|nr:DUF29 family protein [Okeania sp. SIO1I7]NEN89839.1 DUF29 domain-containing protein [Okeania sp. SIO3H1]NET26350.1 DUF29 domain-containing protein [Okeania sp. SIO1I7]
MINQITDLKLLYEVDYFEWLEKTIKLLNNRQLENLDYDIMSVGIVPCKPKSEYLQEI